MGHVVVLSLFESQRKQKTLPAEKGREAEIILFTGVRYERMSNSEAAPKMYLEKTEPQIAGKRAPKRRPF